jgi:hypothetical protein
MNFLSPLFKCGSKLISCATQANPDLKIFNVKKYSLKTFDLQGREDLKFLARKCMKQLRDAKDKQIQLEREEKILEKEIVKNEDGPIRTYINQETTKPVQSIEQVPQIESREANGCTTMLPHATSTVISKPKPTSSSDNKGERSSSNLGNADCFRSDPAPSCGDYSILHRKLTGITSLQPIDDQVDISSTLDELSLERQTKAYGEARLTRKNPEQIRLQESGQATNVKTVARNLGKLFDLQSPTTSKIEDHMELGIENQNIPESIELMGAKLEALGSLNNRTRTNRPHQVGKTGSKDTQIGMSLTYTNRQNKALQRGKPDKSRSYVTFQQDMNSVEMTSFNEGENDPTSKKSRNGKSSMGSGSGTNNRKQRGDRGIDKFASSSFTVDDMHTGPSSRNSTVATASNQLQLKRARDLEKTAVRSTGKKLESHKPAKHEQRSEKRVDGKIHMSSNLKQLSLPSGDTVAICRDQLIQKDDIIVKSRKMNSKNVTSNEMVSISLPKGENTNESGPLRSKKRRRSSQGHQANVLAGPFKPAEACNSNARALQVKNRQNLSCFGEDQGYSFL